MAIDERTESGVVEQEVWIAARPETVFAYFVDPVRMVRWMGDEATLEPRPGGTYRVVNGAHVARGEYVEVVPHSRIVFTWGWEGAGHPLPPGASTVEVTLAPQGDGTLLRLRHSGLSAEMQGAHTQGWQKYLGRLVVAAAGGDPGPDTPMEEPASV
jgi:uncharacterized protein YndB with AHSA1/START domain